MVSFLLPGEMDGMEHTFSPEGVSILVAYTGFKLAQMRLTPRGDGVRGGMSQLKSCIAVVYFD